ncbi:class I tRNA ligase family protein [Streptomyces capparidis]
MSPQLWITATPPAGDGELHIGHLSGPHVAADVLSRHMRAEGQPVLFTTGTAEHADSVEARALRGGRRPEEVAEGYREAITADLLRSGVEFDRVVQPRRDHAYRRWLQHLFLDMYARGALVPRTRLLPYCEPCDRWLYGTYVTGACSHCGSRSGGGFCHECARPHDGDLLAPVCALCGSPGRARRCRRLYLPLEPLRDPLADHWASAGLPPRLAALCESLVEDGLPDLVVGQPGSWGVPVPVNGFPGHRIAAGFEEAAMHLFACGYDDEPLPERTAHFCDFGHAFQQAVVLPAILLVRGVKLPQEFHVTEPYRVDTQDAAGPGGGPTVWALDLLTEFGSDTLRRHVLEVTPLGRSTGFRRDLLDRTRQVLDGTWNGWLTRLFTAVREDCDGLVPDAEPGAGWETLRRRLHRAADDLCEAYAPETFDPRRAVALLDEVVRCTADFGHVNAFERLRPGRAGGHLSALAAQLSVASALKSWAWPVMPEGAGRLAAALRGTPGGPVHPRALVPPPAGTRLSPPSSPVFGF